MKSTSYIDRYADYQRIKDIKKIFGYEIYFLYRQIPCA